MAPAGGRYIPGGHLQQAGLRTASPHTAQRPPYRRPRLARGSSPRPPSDLDRSRRRLQNLRGAGASRASRSRARSMRVARACDWRLRACRGRPTPAHHRQSYKPASRTRAPHQWFWGSMVLVILGTGPSCLSVPMLLVILGVCAAALSRLSFRLWGLLAKARAAAIPRERVCVVGSGYRPAPPSLRRVAFFCFRGVAGGSGRAVERPRAHDQAASAATSPHSWTAGFWRGVSWGVPLILCVVAGGAT